MKCENLIGKTFGRWTVIGRVPTGKGNNNAWQCRCACGSIGLLTRTRLVQSKSRSCGCYKRDATIKRNTTHNMKGTTEYSIWCNMKNRCYNKHDTSYKNYGGRGVQMCEQWRYSFAAFFEDMGNRPSQKHSINRKDNNGNYTPDNCEWALPEVQANNTRHNLRISFNGTTKTLTQWAREMGLRREMIKGRIERGWPIDKLFNPPSIGRWHKEPHGGGAY